MFCVLVHEARVGRHGRERVVEVVVGGEGVLGRGILGEGGGDWGGHFWGGGGECGFWGC